jgi:hypothetical protein
MASAIGLIRRNLSISKNTIVEIVTRPTIAAAA